MNYLRTAHVPGIYLCDRIGIRYAENGRNIPHAGSEAGNNSDKINLFRRKGRCRDAVLAHLTSKSGIILLCPC